MSRVSIFVAALSGAVVALALVAQATEFGSGFTAFALVLLPVVFFLGVVTVVRLGQINREDARWMQGMNRIRHAYLEAAPELGPYFVTSSHDDGEGLLLSMMGVTSLKSPLQGFVAVPGVVAVLDSVVAGATAAIVALSLGGGIAVEVVAGAVTFAVVLGVFIAYAVRSIGSAQRSLEVRFPSRG